MLSKVSILKTPKNKPTQNSKKLSKKYRSSPLMPRSTKYSAPYYGSIHLTRLTDNYRTKVSPITVPRIHVPPTHWTLL